MAALLKQWKIVNNLKARPNIMRLNQLIMEHPQRRILYSLKAADLESY